MIRRALLALLILLPTTLALAQPSSQEAADPSTLRIEKLNEKIYVIQGAGGNIAVLTGSDGVLLVDNGVQASSQKVLEAIRSISDKPIRFVINTHWHPDHTGGNATVGASSTVVAHDRTRRWLKQGGSIVGATTPPAPPDSLPNLTIQQETRLYFNGETVHLIPLPGGHTDGDIIVKFIESRIVHVGDIFFADRFPLIDADSGGSTERLIQNLRYLLSRGLDPDARLIPGHGSISSLEGLKKFETMVSDTANLVLQAQERGETLDTMRAKKLLEPWSAWSWDVVPTDRYIELLVKSSPPVQPRVRPKLKNWKIEPTSPPAPEPKKN